jgi:exopolyphosphatase/guanosine-5'-triphosphate,3'-diphosphate pyrophosphatase
VDSYLHTLAAIDIGSNTVRLLVAVVKDGELKPLLQDRVLVRLGDGVEATGQLQESRVAAAIEAIKRFADEARALHADPILAVATSAIRDASNGREFVQRIEQETGVRVEIVSGKREAELTYLGVTRGRPLRAPTVIADVGGGSTEIILANGSGVTWADTIQLGSGRMTERYLTSDPPTLEQLDELREHVDEALAPVPRDRVARGELVGGTASHLATLIRPREIISKVDRAQLRTVLRQFTAAPAAAIAERYSLESERARILPAGLIIIEGIMLHFRLDRAHISFSGIREGVIIAYLQEQHLWPASINASG